MQIVHAEMKHLGEVLAIYAAARRYMKENGNPDQWGDGYPPEALVREDILSKNLYLCMDGEDICAVFYYREGEDETYRRIFDGAWQNDRPYGVVHRIAVLRRGRGVAGFCLGECYERCRNLKIDTHADNLPMQKTLEHYGFARCGIIYLPDGSARIAYQKSDV